MNLKSLYQKDILTGLKREALKFPNFKDFDHYYSVYGNHGIYYHLTENPKWKYRTDTGSRDMSSMASGSIREKGSFMVTCSLDLWNEYYNKVWGGDAEAEEGSEPDEVGMHYRKKEDRRNYVAIVDLGDVRVPSSFGRGFGHEIYLNKEMASKAKVIAVLPLEKAVEFDKRYKEAMPQSEEALRKLWEKAHGLKSQVNENHNTKFIKVYHGTLSKKLPDILKNGLTSPYVGYDSPGWFMLSTDFESALFHANPNKEQAIIVEFAIPVKPNKYWEGFPYLWKGEKRDNDSTWYSLRKPIPKKFIKSVHRIDYDKWLHQKNIGFDKNNLLNEAVLRHFIKSKLTEQINKRKLPKAKGDCFKVSADMLMDSEYSNQRQV